MLQSNGCNNCNLTSKECGFPGFHLKTKMVNAQRYTFKYVIDEHGVNHRALARMHTYDLNYISFCLVQSNIRSNKFSSVALVVDV